MDDEAEDGAERDSAVEAGCVRADVERLGVGYGGCVRWSLLLACWSCATLRWMAGRVEEGSWDLSDRLALSRDEKSPAPLIPLIPLIPLKVTQKRRDSHQSV